MSNMELVFDQAYDLFEKKEFDSAITKIESAEKEINENPASESLNLEEANDLRASISNFKGYNYLGMGDIQAAQKCFEFGLKLNPNSTQACAGLGEVFYLLGMDQESKILFEWAIDLSPQNKIAESGLKKVNKNLGLPDSHYTLNIDLTINKKEKFYSKVATAYNQFSSGNFDDALDSLGKLDNTYNPMYASKDSVDKASSLENFKGFNNLALQNLDQAKICFEKALNLNPNSSQACTGLGELFHLKNEEKESKAMYEWAVKNNPQNQLALNGLKKVNNLLGFSDSHSYLEKKN